MPPQELIVVLTFLSLSYATNNLKVAFQWKQVDFEFPSAEARQKAIDSKEFVQENNLPLGLEVFGDRLFITVPRWKSGVAASLTYIKLTDPIDSPKLHPYPNWEAHKLPQNETGNSPEIVSPFRVRVDQCGRLWVLDTGVANLLGNPHVYSLPQLILYNLHNDTLLRRYEIPKDQVTSESFLANIAVEDENCNDAYAYLGDLKDPGIIVYSFKQNASWRVKHHYFHYNPLEADFNVSGLSFTWTSGVFGMGLTAPEADGYSTLYFHPMAGTHEFSVNTRFLRNATLAKNKNNIKNFKVIGNRGPKGQSSVAFLDKRSGVLFYALVNLNAIACWRTTNPSYKIENQGKVFKNNALMEFANDIKIDANNNLWVLSDRLPTFIYSKLNESDFNFRIFTASVTEAIKNTTCDSHFVIDPNLINKTKLPQENIRVVETPSLSTIFQSPTQSLNVAENSNESKIIFKASSVTPKLIKTENGYEISLGIPIDLQHS